MFTGIVEELGKVKKITFLSGVALLEISAKIVLAEIKIGDSVAVNGVCLTVVAKTCTTFSFEVVALTFKNTNLGLLRIGQLVNLERSLKVGDRISGHFVSGHVDCLGLIRRRGLRNGNTEFQIALPLDLMQYCLPKGSITLDGISLTLAARQANIISVAVIPHTLKNTTLNFRRPSDKLNVELDLLAKKNPV